MNTPDDVLHGTALWGIHTGDTVAWAKTLSERSVRCCITSPPYFGLRDYGTGEWEGGDPGCDHKPRSTQGKTGQRANRTFTATKSSKAAHFAVMPPALVLRCLLAGSAPGDIVVDPFVGSGTTLAVAVEYRRRGIGAELNPDYVAMAKKRVGGVVPGLV